MLKRSGYLFRLLAVLVVLSMVLTACPAPAAPSAQAPAAQPAAAQPAGEMSWWAKAAEPYKGVTIRGISESTPPPATHKRYWQPSSPRKLGSR